MDSRSGFGRNSERANTDQKKCTFCGGVNHSAEKNSKGSDSKRENLVRMVIRTTYERNGRLRNVLDMDLKIT